MPAEPAACLPKEQARAIFQRAMLEGSCIWTTHARQQMKERGIDNNDLLALARVGLVLNSPEPHPVTGEWTYRMEAKGPEIKAVFTVLGESRIRLLTVIAD